MKPTLFALPGNERAARALASALGADWGSAAIRHFADGESSVRLLSPLQGRQAILFCTLDRPDEKIVPLLWAAIAARESGASRVGLVAPYLAYMRQDAVFHPGEIVAARHFAALLSRHFDWLVTVDPHLHRIATLDDIYTIPTQCVQAAPAIASWLRATVTQPFLVGPDEESRQWVNDVARRCQAPAIVLHKTRHADRCVEIQAADLNAAAGCTPVLLDDIVATGSTMVAAANLLRRAGLAPPVCVAVHAVFAGNAFAELRAVAAEIVTCDTVSHSSNGIALAAPLAEAVSAIIGMAAR